MSTNKTVEQAGSVLTRIFAASGDLSSGRIGHYVGLITVVVLTGYDTYVNKHLDIALAGMLLGAGTMGYAITKDGDKVSMIASKNSEPLHKEEV